MVAIWASCRCTFYLAFVVSWLVIQMVDGGIAGLTKSIRLQYPTSWMPLPTSVSHSYRLKPATGTCKQRSSPPRQPTTTAGPGRHVKHPTLPRGLFFKEVDHLCIDVNEFLHQSEKKLGTLQALRRKAFNEIRKIMTMLPPKKSLVLAFDGPAPYAKLQRQRETRLQETGLLKSMLTPGTALMSSMEEFFTSQIARNIEKLRNVTVFISDSNKPGEGEIKILNWVKSYVPRDSDDSVVLCGCDADILLQAIGRTVASNNTLVFQRSQRDRHAALFNASVLVNELYSKLSQSTQSIAVQTTTPARQPTGQEGVSILSSLAAPVTVPFTNTVGSSPSLSFRADLILLLMLEGNDYVPRLAQASQSLIFDSYMKTMSALNPAERYLVDIDQNTFNFKALWLFMKNLQEKDNVGVLFPVSIRFCQSRLASEVFKANLTLSIELGEEFSNEMGWQVSLSILKGCTAANNLTAVSNPNHRNRNGNGVNGSNTTVLRVFDTNMTGRAFGSKQHAIETLSKLALKSMFPGAYNDFIADFDKAKNDILHLRHRHRASILSAGTKSELSTKDTFTTADVEDVLLHGVANNRYYQYVTDEDVRLYLSGILWTLQMYFDGRCSAVDYSYIGRPKMTPEVIVRYLEGLFAIDSVNIDDTYNNDRRSECSAVRAQGAATSTSISELSVSRAAAAPSKGITVIESTNVSDERSKKYKGIARRGKSLDFSLHKIRYLLSQSRRGEQLQEQQEEVVEVVEGDHELETGSSQQDAQKNSIRGAGGAATKGGGVGGVGGGGAAIPLNEKSISLATKILPHVPVSNARYLSGAAACVTAISNPKAVPEELLPRWQNVQVNFFFPLYDKKSQFVYPYHQVVAGLRTFGQVNGSAGSNKKNECDSSSSSSSSSSTTILSTNKDDWVFAAESDHETWTVLAHCDTNMHQVGLKYNADARKAFPGDGDSSYCSLPFQPSRTALVEHRQSYRKRVTDKDDSNNIISLMLIPREPYLPLPLRHRHRQVVQGSSSMALFDNNESSAESVCNKAHLTLQTFRSGLTDALPPILLANSDSASASAAGTANDYEDSDKSASLSKTNGNIVDSSSIFHVPFEEWPAYNANRSHRVSSKESELSQKHFSLKLKRPRELQRSARADTPSVVAPAVATTGVAPSCNILRKVGVESMKFVGSKGTPITYKSLLHQLLTAIFPPATARRGTQLHHRIPKSMITYHCSERGDDGMFACSLVLNFEDFSDASQHQQNHHNQQQQQRGKSKNSKDCNEENEKNENTGNNRSEMAMVADRVLCSSTSMRRDFTGGPCTTKRAAQQAAAERAVEWLFRLKHNDKQYST